MFLPSELGIDLHSQDSQACLGCYLMAVHSHAAGKISAWVSSASREVNQLVFVWSKPSPMSFRPSDAFVVCRLQPSAVVCRRVIPGDYVRVVHEPECQSVVGRSLEGV